MHQELPVSGVELLSIFTELRHHKFIQDTVGTSSSVTNKLYGLNYMVYTLIPTTIGGWCGTAHSI